MIIEYQISREDSISSLFYLSLEQCSAIPFRFAAFVNEVQTYLHSIASHFHSLPFHSSM